MKPFSNRIPSVIKFLCFAIFMLALCSIYSTQISAREQSNLEQAVPDSPTVGAKEGPQAAKPNPPIDWSKTLDNISKLATILALAIGGIGAYYKFFKGRVFHPRLQPEVSGKIVLDGEVTCLLVTVQLKNVGVSSIYLTREGTRIDVYTYGAESYVPIPHLAIWDELGTFRIFTDHGWIESGEAIKDELLIPVPAQRQVAFKIEMTANSKGISFRSKAIIPWVSDEENEQRRKETKT